MRNLTSLSIAAIIWATVSSTLQAQQPTAPQGIPLNGYASQIPQGGYYVGPGYPYLDAPLYSSPVQYVPYQVGGTLYTNQALYPHEMLYPHKYKALYPPFYYKVRGRWVMTRNGVKVKDHWYLEGTEVKVKYKDHFGLFSNIHKRHFN